MKNFRDLDELMQDYFKSERDISLFVEDAYTDFEVNNDEAILLNALNLADAIRMRLLELKGSHEFSR